MSNLPKKGPGRPPGSVNKATADARQAIAAFVDGNAHRLTEWLDQVAGGVKKEVKNEEGEVVGEEYVVVPNPAKAFDMFQSVVEYHIPKLARQEALAKLGQMAAVVAHEVRNPLAGIKGAIQILISRRQKDDGELPLLRDIVSRIDKVPFDRLGKDLGTALASLNTVAPLVASAPPDLQKQYESLKNDATAGASR